MKIQQRVLVIGIFCTVSSILVLICSDSFTQNAFGNQENFVILQTGIISTEDRDFAVSNIFETRILQDGKIMRVSGITTTGEAYYVYQKIEDSTTMVNGKILINGVFISIISKEVVAEPEDLMIEESKLDMVVKIPSYTYSNYPFVISVRAFDTEKNTQPIFEDSFGILENVFVNVTITNRFDKFVTSLTGNTDSSGLFRGSYLVNEGITGQGKFNVNVVITDGMSSTSKSFTTFFRGDIRYYDDNNP